MPWSSGQVLPDFDICRPSPLLQVAFFDIRGLFVDRLDLTSEDHQQIAPVRVLQRRLAIPLADGSSRSAFLLLSCSPFGPAILPLLAPPYRSPCPGKGFVESVW